MILDEIAAKTRERIAERKKGLPLETLKAQAEALSPDTGFPFEQALAADGISFICEVKKASPSKGLIAADFPYLQIAKDYEKAGASAISCLTEPFYFQGSNEYLKEITAEVKIPVLRKDFTVDPYMIYEAKVLGASAVLLICAILTDEELKEYLELAHKLGLSALIEAHTAEEVERALKAGGRIIGVNNRDLKTFHVDVTTSLRLRSMVPENFLYVSESGIKGADDIAKLYENGTDAVLIGETLMRADDKQAMLEELASGCR
jgi:indole-3-glycerol phosphate synthase